MLEVVFQTPSCSVNIFWCFLEHLPQFKYFYPPDIPHFVMLGNRVQRLRPGIEDKSHPWEPTLELLLTAEWDKGEAVVVFGGIGLGANIRIKARHS